MPGAFLKKILIRFLWIINLPSSQAYSSMALFFQYSSTITMDAKKWIKPM
jgi:hypothetical protein